MNRRPLTEVSADTLTALTPEHFLAPLRALSHGSPVDERPDENNDEEEYVPQTASAAATNLRQQWSITEAVLRRFWYTWRTEYLAALAGRYQRAHIGPHLQSTQQPEIGQLVVIVGPTANRSHWNLGRITKLVGTPPKAAEVVHGSPPSTFVRPLNLLCPLELESDVGSLPITAKERDSTETRPPPRRSRRLNTAAPPSLLTILLAITLPSPATSTCTPAECGILRWDCCTSAQQVGAITLGTMALVALPLLCWCCGPLFCLALSCGRRCFRKCYNSICRPPPPTLPTRTPPAYRRRRRHLAFIALVAFCAFAVAASASPHGQCDKVAALASSATFCTDHLNGSTTCAVEFSTLVTLRPTGQTVCLQLTSGVGKSATAVATLAASTTAITLSCIRRNLYYTRAHVISTESVHRCFGTATCTSGACEAIHPSSKIPELSDKCNRYPGYSFCSRSCGCVSCGGCFLCTPSCMFYRHFATPAAPEVFEVYDCTQWTISVTLDIQLRDANNDAISNQQIRLAPTVSVPAALNSSWTLAANTGRPMPVLGSTFVTDGIRTAVVEACPRGQPCPGRVGQLQCTSRSNAERFECWYAPATCQCTPSYYEARCLCSHVNMDNVFTRANMLPLHMDGLTLRAEEEQLKAYENQHAGMQVVVNAKSEITLRATVSKCHATVAELQGCFRCRSAATAEINCVSTPVPTNALLQCTKRTYAVGCAPDKGQHTTLSVAADKAEIDEECELQCAGSTQVVHLRGNLHEDKAVPVADYSDHEEQVRSLADLLEAVGTIATAVLQTIADYFSSFVVKLLLIPVVIVCMLLFIPHICQRFTIPHKTHTV